MMSREILLKFDLRVSDKVFFFNIFKKLTLARISSRNAYLNTSC